MSLLRDFTHGLVLITFIGKKDICSFGTFGGGGSSTGPESIRVVPRFTFQSVLFSFSSVLISNSWCGIRFNWYGSMEEEKIYIKESRMLNGGVFNKRVPGENSGGCETKDELFSGVKRCHSSTSSSGSLVSDVFSLLASFFIAFCEPLI